MIGKYLTRSNHATVLMSGGLSGGSERPVDEPRTTNFDAIVALTGSIYNYDYPKTNVDFATLIFPALKDPGRVRINASARLRRELLKDLFISFNVYDTYDSRPPTEEANNNDVGFSLSLRLDVLRRAGQAGPGEVGTADPQVEPCLAAAPITPPPTAVRRDRFRLDAQRIPPGPDIVRRPERRVDPPSPRASVDCRQLEFQRLPYPLTIRCIFNPARRTRHTARDYASPHPSRGDPAGHQPPLRGLIRRSVRLIRSCCTDASRNTRLAMRCRVKRWTSP